MTGRLERDVKKRAAIYAETQKRMQRDLICLPISDLPGQWARNPEAREHAVRSGVRGVLAPLQL